MQKESQLAYIRDSKSSRVVGTKQIVWGQAGDAVTGAGYCSEYFIMGATGESEQTRGRSDKQTQGVLLLSEEEGAQRRSRCQIGKVTKEMRAPDVLKAELSGLAKDWVWGKEKKRIPECLLGVEPECWRKDDANRCVIGGQNRPGKYRPSDHSREAGWLGRQVQVPQAHTVHLYSLHNILTKLSSSPAMTETSPPSQGVGFVVTNISFK